MQEIKCPNCGKVFQVDESGYAQIMQQVRDKEFEKELERREQEIRQKKEDDLKIERMEQEKIHSAALARKDSALAEIKQEVERLKAQLQNAQTEKKLAVTEAVQKKDQMLSDKEVEIEKLMSALDLQKKEGELRENNLVERHRD